MTIGRRPYCLIAGECAVPERAGGAGVSMGQRGDGVEDTVVLREGNEGRWRRSDGITKTKEGRVAISRPPWLVPCEPCPQAERVTGQERVMVRPSRALRNRARCWKEL